MKRKLSSIVSLLTITQISAQVQDSIKTKSIDEVVVTGQYKAQNIDKSIYKVEVINEAQIKSMAANSVADVLNQSLNMQIIPDSRSGNSSANILGLDGNYVKILIDNIAVVGDTGLGSNIDLTKISLINIERIEIVNGSMGVEYGNGAMAGVINIITKKSSQKKISGRFSFQEETVRDQYDIRKKGQGRHIQNMILSANLNSNWFVTASVNHNQFMGYEGSKEGYKYFEMDNHRGYDWNPKNQYDANALVKYVKGSTSLFYKISYLKEDFNFYNPKVEKLALNDGLGGVTYTSIDREYNTKRWIHQLNVQTSLGQVKYAGDFSYQSQDRQFLDYVYDIPNRKVLSEQNKQSYYSTDIFYSRGLFSNFTNSEKFNFQLGYELDHTNGYAALIAGDFFNDNIKRTIFTYANFLSAEWNINKNFSLRPGVRLTVSNQFENLFNMSLTARYKLSKNSNLRSVFGTANVLPTYEQLFTYFVNTNHDLQGNPNLKPEKGYSLGLFWDNAKTTSSGLKISYGANALFLNNSDRIEMVMIKQPSTYKFLNIDDFKSMLFSGSLDLRKDNVSFGLKASVNGISREMKSTQISSPTDYKFSLQAGASAHYKIPSIATNLSLFYKYAGAERRYVYNSANNAYTLGKIDAFSMLDFIVGKTFFQDRVDFSLGVKNIFDVTTIQNSTTAASGHNEVSGNLNLFYGRSYFIRLMYQF